MKMGGSLRLGKILGITIQLHFSWFIIFALFIFLLSYSLLDEYSLWTSVIVGVLTSILLFASVVAHELAHSLVAIRNGIPVKSITLFFLGGVAQITREAARPKTELLMAIAGPLCSLVLAGIFGSIWFLVWGNSQQTFTSDNPILWLASINLMLALFNLIPGFPLDGGRILRALIWQRTGNYKRATRIASLAGQSAAYLMIGGGIAIMFINISTNFSIPVNGIMLAFIGWFLHHFATTSYRQVEMREALRGFTAGAMMGTDYIAISPGLSLKELVQNYVLPTGRRYFVVAEDGRLAGMVSFENIKTVPQTRWDITPVRAVMTPADKVVSARPEEEALSILERMEEHDLTQMPVVKERVVLGIIVRENLLHFIRLRSEMGF
jgi:Zn-dependent protease/CBS domain-containing protein